MKTTVLAIMASLLAPGCAWAESAKQDALLYQSCIISMKHISETEIDRIMRNDANLKQKTDDITKKAADRCKVERASLERQLSSENRTDQKFIEMPEKIRVMSIFALKAQLLDAVLKGRKSKRSDN